MIAFYKRAFEEELIDSLLAAFLSSGDSWGGKIFVASLYLLGYH